MTQIAYSLWIEESGRPDCPARINCGMDGESDLTLAEIDALIAELARLKNGYRDEPSR